MAATVPPEIIVELQKRPERVRNVCILAHVDHGKTTLADSLIASNGIISQRHAGKLRYMDSRNDEQARGITMKASAIALRCCTHGDKEYVINLIDSPGHVDFSSEVSTAVRLCDGALVVVDVVEGVCPQTHVVLDQAWKEGIRPCLVLNKLDRLITELKLSPTEAYYHMQSVLEQVNAITGALWMTEAMEQSATNQGGSGGVSVEEGGVSPEEVVYEWSAGLEDKDDSTVYFSPEQGNVIFSSALDGWGFGISHFAAMYSKKLNIREQVLAHTLWGDYYLNSKTKRVHKGAYNKGKKPLFVQFVLDNLWSVYDAVLTRDKDKVGKIINSLQLKIAARDIRHNDPRVALCAICYQWLPLAQAALQMVVCHLPSPLELSRERAEHLMCTNDQSFDSLPPSTQQLRDAFQACSSEDSHPVIAYISKMFTIDKQCLPQHKTQPLTMEEIRMRRDQVIKSRQTMPPAAAATDDENQQSSVAEEEVEDETSACQLFLAFARVYSGTITRGQELFVLHPRYDPHTSSSVTPLPPHASHAIIQDLYLLMGREIVPISSAPAGSVVGIAGLEDIVLKTATLSSSLACPAFRPMSFSAAPIVRVAIEPEHVVDMPALVRGLKLLNQADPCVEVMLAETGEHVLVTAGEVHLKRCIDDLRERFVCVDLNVSTPIIPFRETVVLPPSVDMVNELISEDIDTTSGPINIATADKSFSLQLDASPLPESVVDILLHNTHLLRVLDLLQTAREEHIDEDTILQLQQLKLDLNTAFLAEDESLVDVVERIWAFGPRHVGPNILLNRVPSYQRPSVWSVLFGARPPLRDYDNSIVSGFQLASLSGPLCEEPLHGVCFTLLNWTSQQSVVEEGFGPLSGQLISAAKEGCRKAFLAQPARLMAAMYTCDIRATAEVLGRVYAVLGRRNGRVIHEEMREGSVVFVVKAALPVAESFGFADEIRKKTSGLASPQLVFSHWEVIPHDPFWVPSTEEELQHFGEKADTSSLARQYMNDVRRRKGLSVQEKLVEHAEKQRTLKKNK